MSQDPSQRTCIVVARCIVPGWLEVVEDFKSPEGDIDYPYMRAAHAEAEARSSMSRAEFRACVLCSPVPVGRQFNCLSVGATYIDHVALQSARPH